MEYSHRDLRAHREVGQLVVVVLATLLTVAGATILFPGPVQGILGVVALAALGALAMHRGNRIVRRYETDRRSIHHLDGSRLGALGVEVRSSVPLTPSAPSPTRRSPHSRRPVIARSSYDPPIRAPRPEPSG